MVILNDGEGQLHIVGLEGNDTIQGTRQSNNILEGNEGNDVINDGYKNDTLDGGTGDDQLNGSSGSDTYIFKKGYGKDVITDTGIKTQGIDRVIFGQLIDPDKVVFLTETNDLVIKFLENNGTFSLDELRVRNYFIPNSSNDGRYKIERFEFADGTVIMSSELDVMTFTVTGTENDDVIVTARTASQNISGLGGNDRIYTSDLNDVIDGGAGDDYIDAKNGSDFIVAGLGNDTIYGGNGNDIIHGNEGNDAIYGGNDNDTIFGDEGEDIIFGGTGNDEIDGGAGSDTIYGGDGNDRLKGGAGNDIIYGGFGSDVIEGGAGNDILYAASDNEYDYLETGTNTFVFEQGFGQDVLHINKNGIANNVISFGEGIIPSNVYFEYAVSTGMFVIKTIDSNGNDTGDSISFTLDQFDYLSQISFFDGTQWDSTALKQQTITVIGSDENDTISLSVANPLVIKAGAGNDTVTANGIIYGEDGDDTITGNGTIYGGAGNDTIAGMGYLYGGDGNDEIHATSGSVIEGGLGDDYIDGDSVNTSIYFGFGEGKDTISGVTTINLREGITTANVLFAARLDGTIVLQLVDNNQQLTGDNLTLMWFGGIESIQFHDGTQWDQTYLSSLEFSIVGTDGDDEIISEDQSPLHYNGLGGNDHIVGNGTLDYWRNRERSLA